jgi:hypothetical protein
MEGAVGILMFGWSTGIMAAAITRIYGEAFEHKPDNQPSTQDQVGEVR